MFHHNYLTGSIMLLIKECVVPDDDLNANHLMLFKGVTLRKSFVNAMRFRQKKKLRKHELSMGHLNAFKRVALRKFSCFLILSIPYLKLWEVQHETFSTLQLQHTTRFWKEKNTEK